MPGGIGEEKKRKEKKDKGQFGDRALTDCGPRAGFEELGHRSEQEDHIYVILMWQNEGEF